MLTDVTTRADPSLVPQYIVNGSDHIISLLLTSITVCAVTLILVFVELMQFSILIPATVLWGIVILQSVIATAMPSTLFGHWKEDKYKEKLEWDAFAHFLSDLAMIRKYAPEDLSMWGEWLVYGTASGVGDKVESAMAALNINIADTGIPAGAAGIGLAFTPILFFAPPVRGGSGGFGRGGFGRGGGFGGGARGR